MRHMETDGLTMNRLWSICPTHYTKAVNRSKLIQDCSLVSSFMSSASTVSVCASVDTPLHVAASRGDLEVVKELVFYGADKNARNASGDTPLHVAAANG